MLACERLQGLLQLQLVLDRIENVPEAHLRFGRKHVFGYAGLVEMFQHEGPRFVAWIGLVLYVVPAVRVLRVLALRLFYLEIRAEQRVLRYVLAVVEPAEQLYYVVRRAYELAGHVDVGAQQAAHLFFALENAEV